MLSLKTIDCLSIAELPIASPERLRLIDEAILRWSYKAVRTCIVKLVKRGYIEPLLSGIACGMLTMKGYNALKEVRTGAALINYGNIL